MQIGVWLAWLNFSSLKIDPLVHQMETRKSGKYSQTFIEVRPLPDMITAGLRFEREHVLNNDSDYHNYSRE
jgi:hypothetical protein